VKVSSAGSTGWFTRSSPDRLKAPDVISEATPLVQSRRNVSKHHALAVPNELIGEMVFGQPSP
jgi:hypothetical protein